MFTRSIAALAAAPLAVLALSAPAQAGPAFESGTYDETFHFNGTSCGMTTDVTLHQWGRYALRDTGPGAPEVIVHDVGQFSQHFVTGAGSWWITGKNNFKITAVTNLHDDVWQIDLAQAGRNWVLTSESGTVVWADRGILHETLVLDTLGDDDPENDVVISDDYAWNGPHFVSDTGPNSLYCQYVAKAIALG